MTENCQWFTSRLDAYFEETLARDVREAFDAHRASCPECERKFAQADSEISQADPVLRQVLRYRIAQSQAAASMNSRPRVWRLALAGSGLAVAALLAFGVIFREPASPPPVAANPPAEATSTPDAVAPVKTDKVDDVSDVQRAKPEPGAPSAGAAAPNSVAVGAASPDFAVIDAAGYSASLETYRGKVLLFAVISPEHGDAVKNLQGLYAAFGANPDLRVLGILTKPGVTVSGFPVFYNHGSRLLGVEEGQFLLADPSGKTVLKGVLNETNTGLVKAELEKMIN